MGDFDISGHVLYQLRNATVKTWPFPHFYVQNVFPGDFYGRILAKLAEKTDFQAGERHYEGRKFAKTEDFPEFAFMETREFLLEVTRIFTPWMKARFADKKAVVNHDLRLVRDPKGYSIGPHTDAAWKVISLLFYLPANHHHSHCGTSLYLPKNRDFRCPGGPHYDPIDFDRIWTAPYLTNACFGFFKTDNSFHGVEPLAEQFNRDVLLFNVYDSGIQLQTHKPAEDIENGHP